MSDTRTHKHTARPPKKTRQAVQRRQATQRRDAERLRERYEAEAQPIEIEAPRYKP